jgi:hypothetical protein
MWFVGGPMCAFVEGGAYLDTAMHYECMEYALKVCPYLAARKYDGRIDLGTFDLQKIPEGCQVLMDYTMIPERPALFVAVAAITFAATRSDRHPEAMVIRPTRPYIEMEFWKNGERLEKAEGARLAADYLEKRCEIA